MLKHTMLNSYTVCNPYWQTAVIPGKSIYHSSTAESTKNRDSVENDYLLVMTPYVIHTKIISNI